jgi:hypothetical protein
VLEEGPRTNADLPGEATARSDSFAAYMPDRRSRGLNGPHSEHRSLEREAEDLDAVFRKAGHRESSH